MTQRGSEISVAPAATRPVGMAVMTRISTVLVLISIALSPGAASALEFQNWFLKRPLPGQYTLEPCSSTRDDEQVLDGGGVAWLEESEFASFFTAPDTVDRVIPEGTATATLYLTTGTNGTMLDCAEVRVRLARETMAGTFPIAEAVVTTSLFPKFQGGLGNPAIVPIPVTGPEGSRTLAAGDLLRMRISVKNVCEDQQGRQVNLRYDSRSTSSRIRFENVDVPDEGGAADPDTDGIPNLCDNCPDIANQDQTDTNRDGMGDACTPCTPEGPVPPECACLGDGCNDADECTLDSCDDQAGCVNDPIPFLEGVRCRLTSIDAMLDAGLPDEIDPKLQKNRSPLRRRLAKSLKALGKAERAVLRDKPERKVDRKVRKLRAVIAKFITAVEKQRSRDRIMHPFSLELIGEATAAIVATNDRG